MGPLTKQYRSSGERKGRPSTKRVWLCRHERSSVPTSGRLRREGLQKLQQMEQALSMWSRMVSESRRWPAAL